MEILRLKLVALAKYFMKPVLVLAVTIEDAKHCIVVAHVEIILFAWHHGI